MFSKIDKGKFRPPSDVIVTDFGFVIRVEIAAMQANDFKVSLLDRKLVISGVRQLPEVKSADPFTRLRLKLASFG